MWFLKSIYVVFLFYWSIKLSWYSWGLKFLDKISPRYKAQIMIIFGMLILWGFLSFYFPDEVTTNMFSSLIN
jgi:hypothetical protein